MARVCIPKDGCENGKDSQRSSVPRNVSRKPERMSRLGTYDHLNKDTPIKLKTEVDIRIHDMKALVTAVRESNYGVHRFLSELIRQDKEYCREQDLKVSEMMRQIEAHLNEGHYR